MKLIYLSAILCAWASGAVGAQEYRKPDEIKEIVIRSTYPVNLALEMTQDEELYVWIGYRPVYKTTPEEGYHLSGFLTDTFQVYKNGRMARETAVLKDIPNPRSIKTARIGFDLEIYPRHGEDRANTIVLSSAAGKALPGMGFTKDRFTLGPFPYQVNGLWTKVRSDKGLVWLKANCGNTHEKVEKDGVVDPFYVLFTLNKELELIDSFVFDRGREQDKYEMYTSGGIEFLTNTGNFYQVGREWSGKKTKITVKKWRLKG